MILAVIAIIGNIALPPARFNHEPKNVLVYEYLLSQVEIQCQLPSVVSCAWSFGDLCIIILPIVGPGGVNLRNRMLLRQHEYGHCNGWSKDHEK